MSAPAIVIPSAGRAQHVATKIAGAVLYVPDDEEDAYQEHNPGVEVVTHGAGEFRNLAEKRQAILERWGSVFMVDDDVDAVWRLYLEGNSRKTALSPEEIRDLVHVTADNAARAGCYLWGFNATPQAGHYYPHKPIELTAYINGCAMGLHPSPRLYFTPRTTAAESHWINLLNARQHRRAWVDMRFHFHQAEGSTFTRPGGQAAHRTMLSEMQDTLFLRRMFGQAVQMKPARGGSGNVHQFQRTIRNPL